MALPILDEIVQVDIREGAHVLRDQWRIIALITLLSAVAAVGLMQLQTRRYEAAAILLVGQDQGIGSVQDVSQINDVTKSLARLVLVRVVLQDALAEIGDRGVDLEDQLKQVRTSVPTDTQTIEVTVTDPSKKRAAALANAIAESFAARLTKTNESLSGTDTQARRLSASVWQPAFAPAKPTSPSLPFNIVIGILVGAVTGALLGFVRDERTSVWRDEQQVEKALGIPVIGTVPPIARMRTRGRSGAAST